jgi:tetratricopeptide (TPR) repeat protein
MNTKKSNYKNASVQDGSSIIPDSALNNVKDGIFRDTPLTGFGKAIGTATNDSSINKSSKGRFNTMNKVLLYKNSDGKIEPSHSTDESSNLTMSSSMEIELGPEIVAIYYCVGKRIERDQAVNSNGYTFGGLIGDDPEKAETSANETFVWLQCAEAWLKLFNNQERALRCARKAEDCAKEYLDWCGCSDFWLSVFPDTDNAIKCIIQADSRIKDDEFSYVDRFDYWLRAENTEKARECLKMAEESQSQYLDWLTLAELWRLSLKEPEEAMRCVLSAEEIAISLYDWLECAKAWDRMGLRKETTRVLRSLLQKEDM